MIALQLAFVAMLTLASFGSAEAIDPTSPSPESAVCPNAPNELIRTCPKNEEFQCCGACEQLSCDKRASTVRCFRCPSDCYCKEGYIRERCPRANGSRARCIPIKKCPATAKTTSARRAFAQA